MESSKKLIALPALRNAFNNMTRSEQQIAIFLSEHTEDFIQATVPELAKRTGKSEITLQRFCKKLGFNGMQELKLALAAYLPAHQNGGPYGDIHIEDSAESIARKLFQNIADGLTDSLKLLDFDQINQAVTVLDNAQRIGVYGFGNSATVCRDIETRFLRLGTPVQAYSDAHQQVTSAALLTPKDAVIAVSHSGETSELLDSVHIAQKNGAKIIAITSHAMSDLAKTADIVLHGMGREVHYRSEAVSSRFVHIAIADVLYTALALRHPQVYQKNLACMRKAIAEKRL